MALFSERNHLRKEIEKTYEIKPTAYRLLFKCCLNYCKYLSWLFPQYCPDDGYEIVNYDVNDLIEEMRFEIPTLVDSNGFVEPLILKNVFNDEESINYDQYAILDFIEYIFQNIKDFEEKRFHTYFNHFHLHFLDSRNAANNFLYDINRLFSRTGLLYELKTNGEIERLIENNVTIQELKDLSKDLNDNGLKELINDAVSYYLKPGPKNIENAVEKIWDAFERLKTCYADLDKKKSSEKLIEDISENRDEIKSIITKEFKELTDLGNSFRIRHHETSKIDFTSDNHREYFFNRCLALIVLAIKYIKL